MSRPQSQNISKAKDIRSSSTMGEAREVERSFDLEPNHSKKRKKSDDESHLQEEDKSVRKTKKVKKSTLSERNVRSTKDLETDLFKSVVGEKRTRSDNVDDDFAPEVDRVRRKTKKSRHKSKMDNFTIPPQKKQQTKKWKLAPVEDPTKVKFQVVAAPPYVVSITPCKLLSFIDIIFIPFMNLGF